MAVRALDPPVAHVDDPGSVAEVLRALRDLHGPEYEFSMGKWEGKTVFEASEGRTAYRFVIASTGGAIGLRAGELVRGPSPAGPYRHLDGGFAEVIAPHSELILAGDVLTAGREGVELRGQASYFQVVVEDTSYRAPRLSMLRNLPSRPAGCAAYPDAFRREALPPERTVEDVGNRRGSNRVNEHTLDMRPDRQPPPTRHYHGRVSSGNGCSVNHSETAIVLARSSYRLPEVEGRSDGHAVIYRRPAEDPSDCLVVRLRPGSILVSAATEDGAVGHCFENAFAMLVAIPGFVAPFTLIKE